MVESPGENGNQSEERQPSTDVDGSDPSSDHEDVISPDEMFSALAHPRRRYLLHALVDDPGDTTLREAAAEVAALEQGRPVAALSEDDVAAVHESLYHVHVPKLETLGVLEHDDDGDRVVLRARRSEQLRVILSWMFS